MFFRLKSPGQCFGLAIIVSVEGRNFTSPVGGLDIVRSLGGQCPKSASKRSILLQFIFFAAAINLFSRVLSNALLVLKSDPSLFVIVVMDSVIEGKV